MLFPDVYIYMFKTSAIAGRKTEEFKAQKDFILSLQLEKPDLCSSSIVSKGEYVHLSGRGYCFTETRSLLEPPRILSKHEWQRKTLSCRNMLGSFNPP